MGIQLIVETNQVPIVEEALGVFAVRCEIFPIEFNKIGVSVPTKVVDEIGDDCLFKQLAKLRFYNLWSGKWVEPKPKWKFW